MTRGELNAKFQELGITDKMIEACKLPFQAEPKDLIDAGLDYYGRKQKLASKANEAWINMRSAAKNEGLNIQIDFEKYFQRVSTQEIAEMTSQMETLLRTSIDIAETLQILILLSSLKKLLLSFLRDTFTDPSDNLHK